MFIKKRCLNGVVCGNNWRQPFVSVRVMHALSDEHCRERLFSWSEIPALLAAMR